MYSGEGRKRQNCNKNIVESLDKMFNNACLSGIGLSISKSIVIIVHTLL